MTEKRMSRAFKAPFLLLAVMALKTVPVLAQLPGPGGPDGPMEPPVDSQQMATEPKARILLSRYSKELKLTDDQKTKIMPILEAEQHKFETLHKSSLSLQEQGRKMEGIEQDSWAAIRPLLIPQQQKKFDAMTKKMTERRERAARRAESGDDGPPDGPPSGGGPPPDGGPPMG